MNRAVKESEKIYSQVVEYSDETIFIHSHHKILYINESGAQNLRGKKEDLIGCNVLDVIQESSKESIIERIRKTMEEGVPQGYREERVYRLDGTEMDVELHCHPVVFGDKKAIQTTFRDITDRKDKERKHQQMLNELSTPIVPVVEGIFIVPLVGSIDEARALQLLEKIPSEAQKMDAEVLIIDFSGIYTFDEVVIEYVLKIHQVLELLGVHPILTGLRPNITQSAVQHGGALSYSETMATVQQALKRLGVNRDK